MNLGAACDIECLAGDVVSASEVNHSVADIGGSLFSTQISTVQGDVGQIVKRSVVLAAAQ